jgi:hypothetical protein
MRKFFILLAFLGVSSSSFAIVKCELENVKGIQVKSNGDVWYLSVSGKKRKIGSATSPTTPYSLRVVEIAMEKQHSIQAAFPDGYDCASPNPDVLAEWVFIQNGL